jgi:hypothetical protein
LAKTAIISYLDQVVLTLMENKILVVKFNKAQQAAERITF